MNFAKIILNNLIPSRCLGCNNILYEDQQICPSCWKQIDFISEPFCQICHMPFAFDSVMEQICQYCADEQPPFTKAYAPFVYGGLGAGLILRLKHTDHMHISKILAQWMANCDKEMLKQCDVLIPVPIHWTRLLSRRFNQAAVLSHAITKLTGIPTESRALKRIKSTPPQGHMNKADRKNNVKGAFKIMKDITGKTVLLIDDVFTTGATINECAKVLIKGGAKEVYVLTAAKVKFN